MPHASGRDPQPANVSVRPQVSVIIACRGNVADMLDLQLSALAEQDFDAPWELLIADNGIDVGTRALITVYSSRLPAVRIVDATSQPGRSYAINQAVEVAQSDGLITLDSDDIVDSHYLSAVSAALSRHEFVGTRLDSESLNPAWLQARRTPLQNTQLEPLFGRRLSVIGAAMAMRRSAFDKVGGFDDQLLSQEDLDISFRLNQAGVIPRFVPEAVVAYRYRGDLWGIFNQERSYARSEVFLHRKHQGDVQQRTWLQTLRGWFKVLAAIPQARDKAGRAELVTNLGAAVGRIEGSLKYHTLHL